MAGEREFLDFAAGVFNVPAASLSPETTYGSIPEWDSIAQLRLVTEVSARFGVEIPFADVVRVTSLWEFLRRINGGAVKKAVAVDLDGTLWDGVVGEDGPDAIRPRTDFLRELKSLKDRGVLLVALSKNNPEDALQGLDRVADILAKDDFVTWRIDWGEKPGNLASVAEELNLGTDSFVFVDDNPAERLKMRTLHPEVTVTPFPTDLEAYFPPRELTAEDLHKTEEYKAEAKRKLVQGGGLLPEKMFEALGVRLDVHEMAESEVARVAQLSQKANQFDVCTNRYAEDDVRRLAKEGFVVTAHAGDRFGDQGLIAYVIVREGEILDWTMSCRVMGRGIEERIERQVEDFAKRRGVTRLRAAWKRTAKNAPVRDLFDRFGFTLASASPDERRYVRDLA